MKRAVQACQTACSTLQNGPFRTAIRHWRRRKGHFVNKLYAGGGLNGCAGPACPYSAEESIQMGFLTPIIIYHTQFAAFGKPLFGRIGGKVGLYLVPQV